MSGEVISIMSSDEDEKYEPPIKKSRPKLNLSECTLTIVPNNNSAKKKLPVILTVDSDDENTDRKIKDKKKGPALVITLTDDEEETPAKTEQEPDNEITSTTLPNGNQTEKSPVTVAIDDSESDKESCKGSRDELEVIEKKVENSIVINDTDEEQVEKKENNIEITDNTVSDKDSSVKDLEMNSAPLILKDETEEAKLLFKTFLELVETTIANTHFVKVLPKKLPVIEKYFRRCGLYVNDKAFRTLLQECTNSIENSTKINCANTAVLAFHKICENLKGHIVQSTVEVDEDDLPKVKKLERTMELLRSRIRKLEQMEVDFDEDNDSSYIQLDQYQQRLSKVYKKYCEIIKRNPYNGRPMYNRISFVNSDYNEINVAITKKYKNSLKFPNYFEFHEFIKSIVKEHELNLTEEKTSAESKKCFKILGNILQKKRQQDLYESHLEFIESTEDPAATDPALDNVLRTNLLEGQKKISDVVQKYSDIADKVEDKTSEQDSAETSDSDSERSGETEEEEETIENDNESPT